jgi:hypothetical protein
MGQAGLETLGQRIMREGIFPSIQHQLIAMNIIINEM